MNILLWLLVLSGLFSILISFAFDTENFKSAIILKFLPFLFGVVQILVAFNYLNIIEIIIK